MTGKRPFRITGGGQGFIVFLLMLAVLGTALVLVRQINYGVGLNRDASMYVSVARNLVEGNGFVNWNGEAYVDVPPGFPLTLALLGVFGIDVFAAAGWINAVAFGTTVFAATMWLRSRVKQRLLVVWAGLAVALSPLLADLAAMAMSEAMFIMFIVLSLWALDRFLDTDKRSFLLWTAAFAGGAAVTRYVGVTVIVVGLTLILLKRGRPFRSRARTAAAFTAIAMVPIVICVVRNLLVSGTLTGQKYPNGFALLAGLDRAGNEMLSWVLGENVFGFLHRGLIEIGTIVIPDNRIPGSVLLRTFVLLKLFVLSALVMGAVAALAGLRSRGYLQGLSPFVVPAAFVSVYGLALAVSLPITDIAVNIRYLAPFYVPTLVTIALFLGKSLDIIAGKWKPMIRSSGGTWNKAPLFLSGLICLYLLLWLAQQMNSSYTSTRDFMANGRGYASKEWLSSETIQYLKANQLEGNIFVNDGRQVYFLAAVSEPGKYVELPGELPVEAQYWASHAGTANIYLAWFHQLRPQPELRPQGLGYTLVELAESLPETGIVAATKDGVVMIVNRDEDDVGDRVNATTIARGVLKDSRPIIQSVFDVYIDNTDNRLIYKAQCSRVDTGLPFFLHLVPVDKRDLPKSRREYGFENLDFLFRDHLNPWSRWEGFDIGGVCFSVRSLPEYEILEIRTGQSRPGEGSVWEQSVNLQLSSSRS